jgi:hypothetical protein
LCDQRRTLLLLVKVLLLLPHLLFRSELLRGVNQKLFA